MLPIETVGHITRTIVTMVYFYLYNNRLTVLSFSKPIDLVASRMPKVKPDRSEVAKFDKDSLKHVNTTEKSVLPDQKS